MAEYSFRVKKKNLNSIVNSNKALYYAVAANSQRAVPKLADSFTLWE